MGVDVGAGGELLDYGLGGARWQRSRPSIIQLMIPMVAPPVKSRSSSKNPHPHNSNRWQAWPEQCVDGINRRTPHALAPLLQRDSSVPPATEAPLLPGWRT